MTSDQIEARLARVTERLAAAAERAGRSTDEVEVLPVTKGHPAHVIEAVAELGFRRIGENRVPEAEAKRAELGGSAGVDWVLIGRLQRNKARRAVRLFDMIESVDSVRLAAMLSRIVAEEGREPLSVLVQLNPAGEVAKTGFSPGEAVEAVEKIAAMPGLVVDGLMAMAPFVVDEATLRQVFRRARSALARCQDEVADFGGQVLSMGMSNDFEIAIEEGSTRVRLGTVLLGER